MACTGVRPSAFSHFRLRRQYDSKAVSFTKVVARTVQFLSDNRDDHHLTDVIDGADVPEEEGSELAGAAEV
jgi:hypothetical protein